VRPYSSAYNACVDRAADDFYRGAPGLAYDTAQTMGNASRVCASYGLDPHSLGYSQCIDNEASRGPTQSRRSACRMTRRTQRSRSTATASDTTATAICWIRTAT